MLLNISPPWLVWGPLLAIIFSLAPVASVLLIRWTKEGKPYLGTYTAFWAGEGICFAVLEAITSIVMDGKVPHAFYTEFWFYPVYVAIYIVTWKTTDLFENDAEKRGRPESIRKKVSQLAHNRWCLPIVVTMWSFSALVMIDMGPAWAVIAFIAISTFWFAGLMILWDGKKPMPQTEDQWMMFHPVVMLALVSAGALLQFT